MALTPEQAAALGLPAAPTRRTLSASEAEALGLPSPPPKLGMGDVQAAPSSQVDASNVPVGMLTGDSATDAQIAANVAARGQRRTITPRSTAGAAALMGAMVAPELVGLGPVASSALASGLMEAGTGHDAKDVAIATGVGAAVPVALGAGGKFLTWLGGKVGNRVADLDAGILARATEEKAAEQASRVGKYGGLRQTENKAIREAAAMEAAGSLSPENAALLAEARASGRFNEALNEALANDLEFLTKRGGEVSQAKTAMQEGAAALPGEIESRASQLGSPAEAKRQLVERLKRYWLPLTAGAIGTAAGGPVAGGLAALAGRGVSPAWHSLRRLVQNPAVQKTLLTPLESGLSSAGAALEEGVGPVVAPVVSDRWRALMEALGSPGVRFVPAAADEER